MNFKKKLTLADAHVLLSRDRKGAFHGPLRAARADEDAPPVWGQGFRPAAELPLGAELYVRAGSAGEQVDLINRVFDRAFHGSLRAARADEDTLPLWGQGFRPVPMDPRSPSNHEKPEWGRPPGLPLSPSSARSFTSEPVAPGDPVDQQPAKGGCGSWPGKCRQTCGDVFITLRARNRKATNEEPA